MSVIAGTDTLSEMSNTTPEPPLLGRLIRQARLDKQWTQTDLADKMGTIQSTVSSWESGKQQPKIPQILDLARVLEVDRLALIDAVAVEHEATSELADA